MNTNENSFPWVLFNLSNNVYGISCEHIKAIHTMDNDALIKVDKLNFVKGMMNLRGKIIQILDLRKLCGMKSVYEEIDELDDLLKKRKQDHINWVSALEDSVKEKKEFTLTTNPHACAFGKWYDSFTTEDNMLYFLLKRFDEPHKAIHSVATKVKAFQEKGEYDEAYKLIEKTKDEELQMLLKLFTTLIEEYRESKREIVMVLDKGDTEFGVTVDNIINIEPITQDNDGICNDGICNSVMDTKNRDFSFVKRSKDSSPVILIENLDFFNKAIASLS